MPEIVCISGTNRPQNYTLKALQLVIEEISENNATPILLDARKLSLPFPGGKKTEDSIYMHRIVKKASGVVLATPEYHGSFSAITKLIIENLGFPSALSKKPVALLGVAAGGIGAIKSLEHLKGVCSHIGAIIVPGAVSIAGVRDLFDKDGQCNDQDTITMLKNLAHSLLSFLKEYVCPKYTLEEIVRKQSLPWSSSV
jgi:chromate reductase